MLAPILNTRTDGIRHLVVVAVTGPLTTADHGDSLTSACLPLPRGYGLIVNLSEVTTLSETGLRTLRRLARAAAAGANPIAVVCPERLLRAELELAGLHTNMPVVDDDTEALALVLTAA